jgi:hypothetical protein
VLVDADGSLDYLYFPDSGVVSVTRANCRRRVKPAREEITHHPPEGRRLAVRGDDKSTLVEWLERTAAIPDLCRLLGQIQIVRRRFSLRDWPINNGPPADGCIGLRPQPWWFVP